MCSEDQAGMSMGRRSHPGRRSVGGSKRRLLQRERVRRDGRDRRAEVVHEEVPVDTGGGPHVRVAEDALHAMRIHTGAEHQSGRCVRGLPVDDGSRQPG